MRKNTLICLCLVLGGLPFEVHNVRNVRAAAQATVYYVAPDGRDTNPGTLAAPFQTIQKCAAVAVAGDTCLIRAGTYRETVRPANSGTAAAPITFKPYDNETVTISGADVVTGPWTPAGGSIYSTPLSWDLNVRNGSQVTNNQLWVDGAMMPEARWPNIPVERVTHFTNRDKAQAEGAAALGTHTAVYTDTALVGFAPNAWAGAKINFGPGFSIIHTTCDVTASDGSALTLQCNPDPGAYGTRSGWNDAMLRPRSANYYYLWGKLSALDAPGEWFRADDGRLYLWLPDSTAPNGHTIEAKRRLWAFDLTQRSNITLDGLNIVAATLRTDTGSHHLILQNLDLRYLWHFQEILPFFWSTGTYGIELHGNDNVLRDSVLAFSAAEMIKLYGLRNRAENNVLYDTGYQGSAVAVTGKAYQQSNPGGADKNQLRQNTIFNAGRYPVQADPGLDIIYNDLYNSHLQIMDLGVIYGWGTDGKGAAIAYNWVHDNWAERNNALNYYGGHGIYLDDDTYNFSIYRNVVWNTTSPGIFMYGVNGTVVTANAGLPSNRFVYNNTVDGELAAAAKSNYNGQPQTLAGSAFVNNIGAQVNLSDPQLVANHNLAGDGLYIDRPAHNYTPRPYSPAVDAGTNLGSPVMDPPMVPVNAPDLGALENGRTAWVAGALIRPQDLAALALTCQPQADGKTARCTVSNLPLGRKLPLDFELRIGAGTAATCTNTTDYTSHRTTGRCSVDTSGLTGIQPIAVQLHQAGWLTTPFTVDLRPLDLASVTPDSSLTSGGIRLTLEGRRFALGESGRMRPITLTNAAGTHLYSHPVLVSLETAGPIAAGQLRADCGDLRFHDEYGPLDYWLEEGCNTAATRIWVKPTFVNPGTAVITATYGNAALSSASSGPRTFTFFDDFNDGVLDSRWSVGSSSFSTLAETGGQIRLTGQTDAANQYQPVGLSLKTWQLTLPANFAIDSELSVIAGSSTFKANLGTDLSLAGAASGGKKIAYWNGGWNVVGTSTITSGTFSRRKFTMGIAGTPNRTLRWVENGDLNSAQATWTPSNPALGAFTYSPDSITAFDVRFDNIRIRPYAFPEPVTQAGAEQPTGVRVLIDGIPCTSVTVIDATRLTCIAPPHAAGWAAVTVINPNGESDTLNQGVLYQAPGNQICLPLVIR